MCEARHKTEPARVFSKNKHGGNGRSCYLSRKGRRFTDRKDHSDLALDVATHLVMSFGQTLIHYKVAHHPMGGKFFRNHINFHHTHYSDAHLVSRTYLGDEGNTTPYFFIPVFLVGGCAYFLLPLNLFVVMVIASAASFYAHVFFDKEYHVEGSRLQRFAWFRRHQELHFVHHRHANSNFGVIHFFWDKILGTYRRSDAGA
jgi:hypothetical protein